MPQYVEVKGQVVEFPDGMAPADIEAAIKRNMMSIPPEKPAAVQVGGMLNQIPRQLGLTARYGLEGLADTAQIFTEPVRNVQNLVFGTNARPLGEVARNVADRVGLPKPETANERVIGDATRLVAGSGGLIGGAKALSTKAAPATKSVLEAFASNPTAQLTAAAGGGLAGGASREAGGTAIEQGVSSVIGTALGGLAPGAANAVVNRFNSLKASPVNLEGRISMALKEGGMDWNALPAGVRAQMLADVKKATSTGRDLNADAIRRLADFKATGTTPTRGMLTLDPVQITREQNLAKIGANTADDGLQGLARVQNQNNEQLIRNLNTLGAADGNIDDAGRLLVGSIENRRNSLRSAEQAAWDAAKGSPGYKAPVSSKVISDINQALGDEALMPFMNPTISKYMEAFQAGRPFTPQDYRNLQSMLAREVAKGGNEGAAARLAQRVLERSDLTPMTSMTGPGVTTAKTAASLRAEDAAADAAVDSIDAVNRARAATRSAYAYEESNPLVRSVLSDGASSDPQRIAQRFIVNGTADEAAMMLNEVGPGGKVAIKNAILDHLKSKALSDASDEVGKFSQSAFNKALKQIGDRKLSLFFSPEEIMQLRANGRVASYMQVQPVGSAVNNSNSGALMLGNGYDWLNAVAGKIPFGKQVVIDPLRNIDITLSQRQAQNTLPALLNPQPKQPMPMLLAPAVSYGGLLSAPDRP